jgi:hypothetical protein
MSPRTRSELKKMVGEGLVEEVDGKFRLTKAGRALANASDVRIPTAKKPVGFCPGHLKTQLATDRDGGVD